MKNVLALPIALLTLGLASPAWADSGATRTLTENPTVPAGAGVEVQNLVGHMTVTQGSSFRVTATVVADGTHAQALVQTVKLDVSTQNNRVVVHVHYPVDNYDSYRDLASKRSDEFCILAIFCAHSRTRLDYQGERVSVYHRGGDEGTPLNVNVAVTVPPGVDAKFVNKIGLLEASGLADIVQLSSAGSDIHASRITGNVTADTNGGDLRVQGLTGNLHAQTDGGDVDMSQSAGNLQLQTSGGDARINGVTGPLQADTDGGDLRIHGLVGDLSAVTSGGDADIAGFDKGSNLSVRTDGGDLNLSGDLGATRDLDVSTSGGDAVLDVSHLSMHIDASSDGGDLSVHLPEATNVVSGHHTFSGDIGKPLGKGNVSSSGGDVTISG